MGEETLRVFVPPTVDEVREYCTKLGYGFSAEQFVSFYESKGWMIGKNKMKDWKAACRTWEIKRKSQGDQKETVKPVQTVKKGSFGDIAQRKIGESYDLSRICDLDIQCLRKHGLGKGAKV